MRRNLPAFLISVLCALALVFSACDSGGGGGGGGGGSSSPSSLKIPLPGGDARVADYTSSDARSYLVSIASSRYKNSKSGSPGSFVEFRNIPVGIYSVKIEAKDSSGHTIATATDSATVSSGVTSSVSLKPTPLQYYEVKFLDDYENVMSQMKVTVGDRFVLPECTFPAPNGKEFLQWGIGENRTPAGSAGESYSPVNDINLYAIWIQNGANTYTVTFDPNGGDLSADTVSPVTVEEGGRVSAPVNYPSRAGYTFGGWFTGPASSFSAFPFTTPVTADATAYAVWNRNDYTITYNLYDGTNNTANPFQYNVESNVITLTAPTKIGYTFGGWYTDTTFNTPITQIATGTTGNITLHAKWTPITYTLKLAAGATDAIAPSSNSINCTYDVPVDLSASQYIPKRTNYTFKGWATMGGANATPDSGLEYTGSSLNVKNLTTENGETVNLYACWQSSGFSGTVNDFYNLSSMPTASQSAPYKFVISGVDSTNFSQILAKLNTANSLYFELDLSDSSLTAFGVTTFDDYSTAAAHLTAISLPSSIVKLAYAFADCTNLTSVVVAREYTDGTYTLLPGENNGSDNRTKIRNGGLFELN